MTEPVLSRPAFRPDLSLGWRDGPLDGLSCLLRCIESILRSQGFGPLQVAHALALPLDLTGGRREPASYPTGRVRWRNAEDGREHWDALLELVRAGTPLILMPDRFYWPSDEFEGKQHFLDHMVLVIGYDRNELEVLDTDAPPEHGYIRRIPVTPEVVRSACRFATVDFAMPTGTPETLRTTLLEPMARWIADDLASLRGFAERWERDGLTGPLARALHVLLLGEAQPNLFLTALAVREFEPQLAEAADSSANVARRVGMALLGAHRYAGDDASDRTVYEPVLSVFRTLEASLTRLTTAVHRELGLGDPLATDPDDRLWQHVERMQTWCFSENVAPDRTGMMEETDR